MARKFQILILLVMCFGVITEGITSAQETLTVTGTVIQGTIDGEPLPETVPLQLRILNSAGEEQQRFNASSAADGSFEFTDIPRNSSGYFIISTFWAGIEQTTLPLTAEQTTQPVEFKLYDITDSVNNLVGYRGDLRLDFEAANVAGVTMLLELEYINLGDRIILSEAGIPLVELPVGVRGVGFQSASAEIQRYIESTDETSSLQITTVRDMIPLLPGIPNLLRVSFFLPYEEDTAVVDMRFPFAVNDLQVQVRQETVTVESELLAPVQPEETAEPDQRYQVYTMPQSLEPGEPFKFTLTGKPSLTVRDTSTAPVEVASDNSFSLIFIALVIAGFLVLAGVIVWLLRTRALQDKSR